MAQSHTPRNRYVRFVFGVAAASRNTRFQAARYGLTWAGLAPADRASFAGAFLLKITSSARPARRWFYLSVTQCPQFDCHQLEGRASDETRIVRKQKRDRCRDLFGLAFATNG